MKPKHNGWKEGKLSISLTNGFGTTLEKGSLVRFKRFRSIPDTDNFLLTKYEWHYIDENNQNLVRTTKRTIEGLEIIQEPYLV